jgi:hypothetical protein
VAEYASTIRPEEELAMDDFLREEDCVPNLNTATIAGKVIKVEPIQGKSVGISFIVGYQKHWPSGVQEISITCYVSGAERIEKLRWLKVGEVVLARGELTDKGSLYAHQIEQLSTPAKTSEDVDGFFARMAAETQAAQRIRERG